MLKLLLQGVDKRVYTFIILLTLFFWIISFYVYKSIKDEVRSLTEANRIVIIDEVRSKSSNKLNDIKNILENSAKFISQSDVILHEDGLLQLLQAIKNMDNGIDIVQLLTEDDFFYAQGVKYKATNSMESEKMLMGDLPPNRPLPKQREWYKNTKDSLTTTVTVMELHGLINEQTINICSPVIKNGAFYGALCGILKSSTIVEKLQQLSIPKDITFAIVTQDGRCFTQTTDEDILTQIYNELMSSTSDEIRHLEVGNNSVSIASLGAFSWQIIVATNNQAYKDSMKILGQNSLLMLVGFLILIIFANIAHESIRFNLNKKFNQVKRLTGLWLKDSSRGLVLFDSLKRVSFANQKAKRILKLIYATQGNMYIEKLLKFGTSKEILHVKDKVYEVVVNPLNDGTLFEGWVLRVRDITNEKELEKQKNEYEQLLAHQGKMVEMGELIGGINHQLKQPLNNINILVTNLLQQQQNDMLAPHTLTNNLTLCQKSILHMSETIDLYKDYYKNNEQVREFNLHEAITKLIKILEERIRKNNVKVVLSGDSSLHVNSIENTFQQIMLVLLNNSIDSVKNSIIKEINIDYKVSDKKVLVSVSDFGKGVDSDIVPTLFKNIVETKKEQGSGLGLYFANKLAKNRLNGHIEFKQNHEPTTFTLIFKEY